MFLFKINIISFSNIQVVSAANISVADEDSDNPMIRLIANEGVLQGFKHPS